MKEVKLSDYIKACLGQNPQIKPVCVKASSRDSEPLRNSQMRDKTQKSKLVNYVSNSGYDYKFADGVIIQHNLGKDNTPKFKQWSWNDYTVAHCPEGIVFDKNFIDLNAPME